MMNFPLAPDDPEQRTVIDKLAQFVARNGVDFERLTKEKQQNNPKFDFLFGGEFCDYYQYRLNAEQAIMRREQGPHISGPPPHMHSMPPHSHPPGNFNGPPNFMPPWSRPPGMPMNLPPPPMPPPPMHMPPQVQMQQMQQQLDELREQMHSSERNLAAQHESIMSQKSDEIEKLRLDMPRRAIQTMSNNTGMSPDDFERAVEPIVEACTKENIANAKNWIISKLSSHDHYNFLTLILYLKAKRGNTFETCLHIIYLVNDLLHHAAKKSVEPLKSSLRFVIPALFCEAVHLADGNEEKVKKLSKLVAIWREHGYLDDNVLRMLDNYNDFKTGRNWFINEVIRTMIPGGDGYFSASCNEIENRYHQQYHQLEKQNEEYAAHTRNQIQQIQQMMSQIPPPPPPVPYSQYNQPPPMMPPHSTPWSSAPPPLLSSPNPSQRYPPPLYSPNVPPPLFPPNQQDSRPTIPDTSKPPPTLFPPPPSHGPAMGVYSPNNQSVTPPLPAPYYDLPAGLMAPLVKLEDYEYKPLNPSEIRLPPPCPPSDRLLAAVEAFYAPPTHDNPRDAEGWERLGLFEFYESKERALKEFKGKKSSRSSRQSRFEANNRKNSSSRSSSRSRSGSPLPYLRSSRSRSNSPPPNKGGRY